jgi:hypothetical protein
MRSTLSAAFTPRDSTAIVPAGLMAIAVVDLLWNGIGGCWFA